MLNVFYSYIKRQNFPLIGGFNINNINQNEEKEIEEKNNNSIDYNFIPKQNNNNNTYK